MQYYYELPAIQRYIVFSQYYRKRDYVANELNIILCELIYHYRKSSSSWLALKVPEYLSNLDWAHHRVDRTLMKISHFPFDLFNAALSSFDQLQDVEVGLGVLQLIIHRRIFLSNTPRASKWIWSIFFDFDISTTFSALFS